MSDQRELSLRLNDVLEMVGATEKMRRKHQRAAIKNQILFMTQLKRHTGKSWHIYQCGSSFEGTVTPDLVSDVDLIHCPSEPLVVPHRLMAGPGWFLQVVRDCWTRPGYVKLQLMRDGRELTVYDIEANDEVGFDGGGRACMKHITYGTMHGPAEMIVNKEGRHSLDKVFAYQCRGIPLFAVDWITRHRRFDWPSNQLVDELKMMGCLFVGIGHFVSCDKDLEWRLSFTLQERMMMKSLNNTHHKVYILLKMIKKNVLEKYLNDESLSSYHCKTCVFYMAETTPTSLWVPENLISCLFECLSLLLRWTNDRFCPSFFLKDANLFDKEDFSRLVDPLSKLITLLLQTGHQFIYFLQSDSVGEIFRTGNLMLYKTVSDSNLDAYNFEINRRSINNIIGTFRVVMRPYDANQDSLSLYMAELDEFQHTCSETFPSCTEEEYRTVLCYALPWLRLSIGLEFAARAVSCLNRHGRKELMKKADHHLHQASNTDLVNVRLAKATVLLRLEKLEECFLLLREIKNSWTVHVAMLCTCTDESSVIVCHEEQQTREIISKFRGMSLRKQMRSVYATCVRFERSQIELVPVSLRFEMYRSLGTQPDTRDEKEDAWFDRAAVDANVYLYLLQYLVFSKLNRERHKQIALASIASLTLNDEDWVLGHRETAFNVLGWLYLQERRVADAVRCFIRSWQIRPHHNAAKLHVLVESYRLVRHTRGQNDT